MTRSVSLALVLVALGCTYTVGAPPAAPVDWASLNKPEVVDAGPARATAKERQVAGAYAKAFASNGFAGLGPLLADEARATFGQKNALGRDKVVALHQALFGAFDHRALAESRVLFTDSQQSIEWVLTGVQNADWMGVPATHKPVAIKGVTLVWTQDDGSVADVHVYFDQNLVRAQLGVGPPDLQSLPPPVPNAGPPRVVERAGTDREATNLGALRTMIDALEDNREARYTDSVTDDVQIETLERADPLRGKDAARVYFETMRRGIGQLDTLAQGGFGAGDFAVLEYSISGVQLAQVDRVPFVRNRAIRLHVVDVAELVLGRVSRIVRYDNPAEVSSADASW